METLHMQNNHNNVYSRKLNASQCKCECEPFVISGCWFHLYSFGL